VSWLEKREADQGTTMFYFIMNALSLTTLETDEMEGFYHAKARAIPFSIDGTCCPASSATPKWATFGSLPHSFPRAWFNLLDFSLQLFTF